MRDYRGADVIDRGAEFSPCGRYRYRLWRTWDAEAISLAFTMLTISRKGIPSTQMARELGVTQKTAWFLAQRIRETWLKDRDDHMDGQMQVDETYVGGREKNKHSDKKLRAGRGAVGKTAVVGVRDQSGEVRAVVVENTKAPTLERFVRQHCKTGATIVTDTHGGYIGLAAAGYKHVRINHSVGEYVRDMAHTNGIESFWSLLKRGYIGIYHSMSAKHLHRYVKEYSFRHNTAQIDGRRIAPLLEGKEHNSLYRQ